MKFTQGIRDQFDWPLFLGTCTLVLLGIINLYSSSSAASLARSDVYIHQVYWVTFGAGAAVLVAALDYRHFERNAWLIYAASVGLLVLVFLIGRNVRGSQRWIPLAGFSLQPSELAKLGLIIALAKCLHNESGDLNRKSNRFPLEAAFPSAIVALPMALILAQPDLGTALICAFIFGTMMTLRSMSLRSIVVFLFVVILSAPLMWQHLLKDYQRERLRAFLHRKEDLLDSGWHAYQSLIAIGHGGVWGQGFMQGSQNQYHFLPDQHTDFPFPVWAEEHGLFGAAALLGLYLFIVLRGLRIASQAKDRFGAALATGVVALIFWHTVINLGMVMGLLPVVGVTLPLFSYGGSSVLTMLVGVGLLMNVSMRRFRY